MAIAGSGGWKPSIAVKWVDGHLIYVGIPQNKPPEIVECDMRKAAEKILGSGDKLIQVHFAGSNMIQLQGYLREMENGSRQEEV